MSWARAVDVDAVQAALAGIGFHYYVQTGSTNDDAMAQLESEPSVLCVAGAQRAGRGRRGRVWNNADTSLALSYGFRSRLPLTMLSTLPLMTGVLVCTALESLGANDLALKWPNDLYHDGKKLGGILLETRTNKDCGVSIVVGVGLNCTLSAQSWQADVPATDLGVCGVRADCDQTTLIVTIAQHLRQLSVAAQEGFAKMHAAYRARDYLYGQSIALRDDRGCIASGLCVGVDLDGRLGMQVGDELQWIQAGDVSVRPQA